MAWVWVLGFVGWVRGGLCFGVLTSWILCSCVGVACAGLGFGCLVLGFYVGLVSSWDFASGGLGVVVCVELMFDWMLVGRLVGFWCGCVVLVRLWVLWVECCFGGWWFSCF